MNVKISNNAVTFKITEDEMYDLHVGKPVETKISTGLNKLHVMIDANLDAKECEEHTLKLNFDQNTSCLNLFTSHDQIQHLIKLGKNKEGLSSKIGTTIIHLQVDVRKDSRQKIRI